MEQFKIEFKDFSDKVISECTGAVIAWLEEASGEMQGQIQRNSRVDTGATKGSYEYHVDESKYESIIGSPLENAIWEEFGTGIYALNGDGRKDVPWKYQTPDGKWHQTSGKKPNRPMQRAYDALKTKLIRACEAKFQGLG